MKYKLITRPEQLPKLHPKRPTFCDIETEKLYVGTRLIQFYQPKTDPIIYIFDLAPVGYKENTYVQNLEILKEFLAPLHTIWYNASYDLGTLNLVTERIDDLLYATKTAYFALSEFSLDSVVEALGFGTMYKGLDKKALQKQGFKLGTELTHEQLRYSVIDVVVLAKLWMDKKIRGVISSNDAYFYDILSMRYAIQYQKNGLIVDETSRQEAEDKALSEIGTLSQLLPEGFNPNSYQQVRAYLNTDQSDNNALVQYALSDRELADKARVIIDLKKAKKEYSYLQSINFPKMYTKFNVAGATTGRFTASGGALKDGFNAQQIPRKFQKLFKADTEDTTVVGLDYSTLELRLACTIFDEPVMYKQLKDGEDLHSSMASFVTGKKLSDDGLLGWDEESDEYITQTDRQSAKGINFGYVFGMSAKTYQNYAYVSYGVNLTLEESVTLRDKYFAKYPGFKKYHDNVWSNMNNPSKIFSYTTALGRRVRPKLGTDAINGPVQGSGAETTKLAVHDLVKTYPIALKYIFNVVHDAIYLRVPKNEKELWTERLRTSMVNGWKLISLSDLFKYKDIPMPVGD